MGGSSEVSGVTLVAGEEDAKRTSDSVTVVTSCCTSCSAKASKALVEVGVMQCLRCHQVRGFDIP